MSLTPKQKGWIVLGALAVGIVLLDQGTKIWADSDLKNRPGQNITLIDGYLDLHYARNPGAAFSMFKDWSPATRGIFFVVVSLAAVAAMIVLYRRMPDRRPLFEWALGSLIGGAVGNLIDRLRFNEVIDFLDMHWGKHHWPTYNVADIAIVAGIGLVLVDSFLQRPRPRERGRKS